MQIDPAVITAAASALGVIINAVIVMYATRSKARVDMKQAEQTDVQTDALYVTNFSKLFNNLITVTQEVVDLKKRIATLEADYDILKIKLAQAENELSRERSLRQEAEAKLVIRDGKILELEARVRELEATLGIRVTASQEQKPIQ